MAKQDTSETTNSSHSAEAETPAPANTLTGTGPAPEDVVVTPKKASKRKATRKKASAKKPAGPDVGADAPDLYDNLEAWLVTGGAERRASLSNAAVILCVLALIIGAHWATQDDVAGESADVQPVARALEGDADATASAESLNDESHADHEHEHVAASEAASSDATTDATATDEATTVASAEANQNSSTTSADTQTTPSTNADTSVAAAASTETTSTTATSTTTNEAIATTSTVEKTTASAKSSEGAAGVDVRVSSSADRVGVSLLVALDPTRDIPQQPTTRARKVRRSPVTTAKVRRSAKRSRLITARKRDGLGKFNSGGFEDLDSEKARKRYQKMNLEAARK